MKLHRLLLAFAAIGLLGTCVGELRADGFHSRTGMPWFAYGYSGSLYGLGRLPVPPYYAIHPPVYYSLPQARPYGHSPYAYSGDYRPPMKPARRLVRNPHVEMLPLPEPVETPETTTSTARVIQNPYYANEVGPEASLASQTE